MPRARAIQETDTKEYIINPVTGRKISVGGDKFFELVRKGLVEEGAKPMIKVSKKMQGRAGDKLKAECEDNTHAYEVKEELERREPLTDKIYVVMDNKVFIRNKNGPKVTREKMAQQYSESSVRTAKQLLSNPEYIKRLEDPNFVREVKSLINQNLISNSKLEDIQENSELYKNNAQTGKTHTGTQNKTSKPDKSRRLSTKRVKVFSDSERGSIYTTDNTDDGFTSATYVTTDDDSAPRPRATNRTISRGGSQQKRTSSKQQVQPVSDTESEYTDDDE